MPGFRIAPLFEPPSSIPCPAQIERRRKERLGVALERPLDRANVLGEDKRQGHTGCVNALSWASEGELLLSGGDDTTVRIWKMDTSNTQQEYPFTSRCVIHTGHRANIFSAKMLPHSSRIATAAGDSQVRVFDVKGSLPESAVEQEAQVPADGCINVSDCHTDRAKKLVTEDSPDLFLSVGEDGTVRQHDLRAPHSCGPSSCPAPLVKLDQELCTLSLSPLTPYQIVVAGDGPYGYLYDRRHSRLALDATWGGFPRAGEELTTCVRRFSAQQSLKGGRITGARMSSSNGHEVILSYSGDGVYLFSTTDEPNGEHPTTHSAIIPPNDNASQLVDGEESHLEANMPAAADESDGQPTVPIILPRMRYAGARNVRTIKDVNFLGPNDEWVTSGSDDGNFFMWDKKTGQLHGIYEGDSTVVNMVQGHPELPLIAVSGIDTTVKLFAPAHGLSAFSRIKDAERIMQENKRPARRTRIVRLEDLAAILRPSGEGAGEPIRMDPSVGSVTIGIPDCVGQ